MSIPVPLSVRLRTSAGDRHVTSELDNLTFGSTSPGGYDTCTVSLHRPLRFTPGEVAQFGRLYVYAPAGVVWEGRLQDPGRTAGSDGEVYELAAVGGQAHLQDDTIPLIYVDRDVTHWVKSYGASGEMMSSTVSTTDTPALQLGFPAGLSVPTSAACTGVYYLIEDAGQELAVFDYDWDAGITSSLWQIQGLSSGTNVVRTNTLTTSGGGTSAALLGVIFSLGDARPFVRVRWTGSASSTGGSDDVWASVTNLVVRAVTYLKDGTKKTSGYSASDETILASTVIADWVGRQMTDVWDGANASITATTYAIDQLAYPDGVNGAKLFEDMLGLEPAFTWHVWDSTPGTDRFRFEWLPWPTTVRYEADVNDGFSAPSSGNSLYDRVRVRYLGRNGRLLSTLRTQSVPALTAAGFHRTWFIDQGNEVGSSAAATRAGDQFLADHAAPLNAGRLVVARPILDVQAGRMVQPYEIRAGSLIRVRGVESYPDALNPNSRDGLSIFKVAATSYNAQDAAATLDLDSYAPSVARALAALARRPVTRRR